MSITSEFKQYGEIVLEQGKLALSGVRTSAFAAVGAGDVVVTRAGDRARSLAGRTQDLATTRVSPTDVRKSVEDALTSAGSQVQVVWTQLSRRGEEVVHELRKAPRLQRVVLRTEDAVDSVEEGVEELIGEVSDELTQRAEKSRATIASRARKAQAAVAEGADTTRAAVRKTAARNTNARKSTARKAPAKASRPRNTAARKAPAKS